MIGIIILLIILIFIFVYPWYTAKKKLEKWKREALKKEIELIEKRLRLELEKEYKEKLEEWKETELKNIEHQLRETLEKEYSLKFEEWRKVYEERIREDAIARSLHTILGKVGEQLAPLLLLLNYNLNPKDMRFLGSPVDYIVFKGLSQDNVDEIIFVEIKFKESSKLTPRQRSIKNAVERCRVRWMTVHIEEELKKMSINLAKSSKLGQT